MMRLDKFLCEMEIGSRSQVKQLLRQGLVTVNGEMENKADRKIQEGQDEIVYMGRRLEYQRFVYYMLNKPPGVVSAVRDRDCQTVTDLLKDTGRQDLFPVGRLDKDTEGLLLMTNDGALAHRLTSPRKKVKKQYYCELEKVITREEANRLEQGVDIGDEKDTLPAEVEILEEQRILLTITEGRFHQVKRMLEAVDNRVVYLKRLSMGSLCLDESLKPGEYRPLTEEEVKALS